LKPNPYQTSLVWYKKLRSSIWQRDLCLWKNSSFIEKIKGRQSFLSSNVKKFLPLPFPAVPLLGSNFFNSTNLCDFVSLNIPLQNRPVLTISKAFFSLTVHHKPELRRMIKRTKMAQSMRPELNRLWILFFSPIKYLILISLTKRIENWKRMYQFDLLSWTCELTKINLDSGRNKKPKNFFRTRMLYNFFWRIDFSFSTKLLIFQQKEWINFFETSLISVLAWAFKENMALKL